MRWMFKRSKKEHLKFDRITLLIVILIYTLIPLTWSHIDLLRLYIQFQLSQTDDSGYYVDFLALGHITSDEWRNPITVIYKEFVI